MRKKWISRLLGIHLLLLPMVVQGEEGPSGVIFRRWFVELPSAPTVEGGSAATIKQEQNAFRRDAKRTKLTYTERYAFQSLWNGLSIEIDPVDLGKLSRISGIQALYPVIEVTADLASALQMTGTDVAQSSLGFTGAGVKIGIIDTGIDYDHPDLGGCFGPGCRVAFGYDFVGDAFDGNNTPVPDDDPDDCDGHGTHVAGIAAASGAVTGVAPGATLGAYRVFGCDGTTTADIIVAAMERALADGMDVINMSIGSPYGWHTYPEAAAATRMVNRGMVVVASQGNSGSSGLYSGSAPGAGRKVIGVGSVANAQDSVGFFTITPDDAEIGYDVMGGSAAVPTSGTYPMKRTGTPSTTNDACNAVAPPAGSLTGAVALIRRGTCPFREKALNAAAAGAVGVVIYNNVSGRTFATLGSPSLSIPVVGISDTLGTLIDGRLASGPVDMTWRPGVTLLPSPIGGEMSSFSSWGATPELLLKPNLSAPGGSIRSTYPLEKGGYEILSGTSMAAPHVAGAAALYLEAHPHTPSQAMKGLLQTSADPVVPTPLGGALAILNGLEWPVAQQGAGLLDIDDAIVASVTVEPSEMNLGEGDCGATTTQTLALQNRTSTALTFDLGSVSAMAAYGTITVNLGASDESIAFSIGGLPVTAAPVPGGGSTTVDVTVTRDCVNVGRHGQYGGWVVLTEQTSGEVHRVPYLGFSGDYQLLPVFSLPGWPKLLNESGSPDTFFTMTTPDRPLFGVHLEHQVRRLRFEVKSSTGKSWHRAFPDFEYLPRSSGSNTVFVYEWDGVTTNGNKTYVLPDGSYVVTISALKALGDESNPAHWEVWTSPTFTIDRP